jgi:peptidoglycan/LPS O-acetylase OafA/YrhL
MDQSMGTPAKVHIFPHFRELDGIRGIAALLVFFHHLCNATIPPGNWTPAILELRSLFEFGAAGVDIFFVLSGFLITSLLIRDRTNPAYYSNFYWKRGLRILPVYMLCILGILFFIPHSRGYALLSVLFIVNFANVFHVQGIGPFWSLAIEEQFYLLWPTVVRRQSIATLARWALALAVVAIALRFAMAAFGHYNYNLTFLRCDGLAFGALLACRFERSQRERRPLSSDVPVFAAALIAGILLCFGAARFANPSAAIPEAFAAATLQTGVTLVCGALTGLVLAYAGSKTLSPLRSRLFTFFGLISYALYMVHLYVMMSYDHFYGFLIPGDTHAYLTRLLVVFAVSIVVSLVLRYLVELPALSLRKRVLTKPVTKVETDLPVLAAQ